MKKTIRPEVQKVVALGRMPNESDSSISEEQVDRYAHSLEQIERPITLQEAEQLVKIFPETTLYEVEWTLLHLFESVYAQTNAKEYLQLIELCPSQEWRDRLLTRYKNSLS